MSFWEKNVNQAQKPWQEQLPQNVEFNEEAWVELQESSETDILEEDFDDTAALMSDANLRLEQGRLYQMVLQGDIFADTNADPKAIRNVQREIRKFVKDRMEIMLGIRQEAQKQETTIVSSPFNDMEVAALKMVASKVTDGASQVQQEIQAPTPVTPKKDGITSISGLVKTAPAQMKVAEKKAAIQKTQSKQVKSAISDASESVLQKPIEKMTPEELAAHDKAAQERSKKNHSALPQNMVPHPTPQQLEMLYTGIAAQGATISNSYSPSHNLKG